MASTGKWLDPNVPKREWFCVKIDDLGPKDRVTCEMCEVQKIRYLHHMKHLQHPQLVVGCVCAGYMEENPDGARRRETRFKSGIAKEQRRAAREEQRQAREIAEAQYWTTIRESSDRRRAAESIEQLLGGLHRQTVQVEKEERRRATLEEWRRTSRENWKRANPSLCPILTALQQAIDCPTLTPWESEFTSDVVERYLSDVELSPKQIAKAEMIVKKAVRYYGNR